MASFPPELKPDPGPEPTAQPTRVKTAPLLPLQDGSVAPSPAAPSSEAASRATFSAIRYAQCWEDADVLLPALDVRPGQVCLSISSAGDNTLALLTRQPGRVIALDLNPAQLACLELRVAAYRTLDHPRLLELIGSRPSQQRSGLYARCRDLLSPGARGFWDAHPASIQAGIGSAGKFERYFATFRNRILPLIHPPRRVTQLLQGGTELEREQFYTSRWDTWRWQLLFRVFFSRFVMGRMGRDPSFFRYVEGKVSQRILQRGRYALTKLDPSENPYLQWILTGRHGTALPCALRPENFERIRENLDRLEWHCQSLEEFLHSSPANSIDSFNLSDIFEYISPANYHQLLEALVRVGKSGSRLAYWNTLAPRSRPECMADRIRSLPDLSRRLHAIDKAFFYCAFIVEEIG